MGLTPPPPLNDVQKNTQSANVGFPKKWNNQEVVFLLVVSIHLGKPLFMKLRICCGDGLADFIPWPSASATCI